MKNILHSFLSLFRYRRRQPVPEWTRYEQKIKDERQHCYGSAYELGVRGGDSCQAVEERFTAFCQRLSAEAKAELQVSRNTLSARIAHINADLSAHSLEDRAEKWYNSHLLPLQNLTLGGLEQSLQETQQALDAVRDQQVHQHAELEAQDHYQRKSPRTTTQKPVIYGVGVLFALGEWLITVPALEAMGMGTTLHIYGLSAILTALTVLSSTFSGRFVAERQNVLAGLSMAGGLIVIVSLTMLRSEMAQNYVFTLINGAMYLLATLLAYQFQVESVYTRLRKAKETSRRQAQQLAAALKKEQDKRNDIIKGYQQQALAKAGRQEQALQEDQNQLQIRLEKVQSRLSHFDDYFQKWVREGIAEIRLGYSLGKACKRLYLWIWMISILAGMSSCGTDERTELMLIFDESASIGGKSQQTAEGVCRMVSQTVLKLDEKRMGRHGVRVSIAELGPSAMPKIHTIELPAGEVYWLRVEKERQRTIQTFEDSLKSSLHRVLNARPTGQSTHVNRGLGYLLSQLQAVGPKAHKVVYVFSDLIESNDIHRFESYGKKPGTMLQNYQKIVSTMDADNPWPDLSGITLHLVYDPATGPQELIRASSQFWKRRLEQHHATVSIRSNL